MLEYDIKYDEDRNKKYIKFKNIKNELTIGTFFASDLLSFPKIIKENIEKVLSNESDYKEISFNISLIEISPKTTRIYNYLEDDYENTLCEVNTKELLEVINIFLDECKKEN